MSETVWDSVLDRCDEALKEMQNRCINPFDTWERITPAEAHSRGLALYKSPLGYSVALKPDEAISGRLFRMDDERTAAAMSRTCCVLVFPDSSEPEPTEEEVRAALRAQYLAITTAMQEMGVPMPLPEGVVGVVRRSKAGEWQFQHRPDTDMSTLARFLSHLAGDIAARVEEQAPKVEVVMALPPHLRRVK